MERTDSLDKVRTASVAGDSARRSSLVLIDRMARIGGQAAAVARMTDDDEFDMDDLESDHGLFQGAGVILKSELHDLSGAETFSFDTEFDEEGTHTDDMDVTEPGGPAEIMALSHVTTSGRLCMNPRAKSRLQSSAFLSRSMEAPVVFITASSSSEDESVVPSVLEVLSDKMATSGNDNKTERENAVATLYGRLVLNSDSDTKQCDSDKDQKKDNESGSESFLLIYINLHRSAAEATTKRAVQKLQTLASLLSTSVVWASSHSVLSDDKNEMDDKNTGEFDNERDEVLALDTACRRCQMEVQQQVAGFRVHGATLIHVSSGEASIPLSSPLKDLVNESDERYFKYPSLLCPTNLVFRDEEADINITRNPLKAEILKGSTVKLQPLTEKTEAITKVSALLELLHMCTLAIELVDSQSSVSIANEENIEDEDDEEEEEEEEEELSDARISMINRNSEVSSEAYASAVREREADSRRRCSSVLSELLLTREIIVSGSFEEKKLTEKWQETKSIDLEIISEVMQAYFLRARGPALHSVLTQFLALYVHSSPSPATVSPVSPPSPSTTVTATSSSSPPQVITREQATSAALALQKCQQLNHDLKARVEKLSTENSTLEAALEEKTDKALDAWAVAQEKYEALEEITQGMHVKMASQEELIVKLKRRVLEVEKLNSAMKEGVLRMIREEEGEDAPKTGVNFNTRGGSSTSSTGENVGLSDYLSFALSCATGYVEPEHDTSGIRWNPTPPAATPKHIPNKK